MADFGTIPTLKDQPIQGANSTPDFSSLSGNAPALSSSASPNSPLLSALRSRLESDLGKPRDPGVPFHQSHPVLFTLLSLLPGFGQGYSRAQADQQKNALMQQSMQENRTRTDLTGLKLLSSPPVSQGLPVLYDPVTGKPVSKALPGNQYWTRDTTGKMVKITPVPKPSGSGMFGGTIPADQIDPMAALVAQGVTPQTVAPFSPTARAAVVSRAIKMIQQEKGVSLNEAAKIYQQRQAGFHGRMTASGRLSGQMALLSGFEKSAENIMKNVNTPAYKALSSHLTGSPLANRSILWARDELMGDPAARNWISTLTTLRGEVAKIVSGSLGVAASSDQARREAERIIPDGISPDQFASLMPVIRKELQQRIAGPSGVLRDITGGSYPSPEASVSSGSSTPPGPIGNAPPGITDGPVMYKGQPAVVRGGQVYLEGGS